MEDNKKVGYHIFNLNPSNPYEFRTILSSTGKWVNYGIDNLLPQRFIELNEKSPTHSGIIERKADYTSGKDIDYTTADPSFKLWAEATNGGDGLHNLIHSCAKDLFTFGGFSVQVIWYQYQMKIKDIIYQDFSELRRGFSQDRNPEKQYEQGLWLSADWTNRTKFKPVYHPYFDPKPETQPNQPVFLYYYRKAQGRKWYPIPDWYSAIDCITNEIEMINYWNSVITQSFNPSGFLQVPSMSPDEQEAFAKDVEKKLAGTNNAGKIFTVFADGEKAVAWSPLSDTFKHDGTYSMLRENQQLIITAHKVPSPTLIGLPGGASISGDGNTITAASKEFQDKIIMKAQNEILKQLNTIISLAGFQNEIVIEQNTPS